MNASIKAYRSNVHIQHAPGLDLFRHGKGGEVSNSHDDIPKFLEKVTLEGFRKEIRDHNSSRAMHKVDFSVGNSILDEEIPNVDISGLLSGRCSAISFHLHGTHVVLVKIAIVDFVTLRLNEISGPDGLGKKIAGPDEFCFGRTLCVYLLFGRFSV